MPGLQELIAIAKRKLLPAAPKKRKRTGLIGRRPVHDDTDPEHPEE